MEEDSTERDMMQMRFIEVASKELSVSQCCELSGVSRSTFYRWKAEDAFFRSEYKKAREKCIGTINDIAEGSLIAKVKEGDFRVVKYWLEHHHKDYNKDDITDLLEFLQLVT